MSHRIVIDLPDDITIGDMLTVKGALIDASTSFVDWADLSLGERDGQTSRVPNPISAPGRILLALAHQLGDKDRETIGET